MRGHASQDGAVIALSAWDPAKAETLFAGCTVDSIVLEAPSGELVGRAVPCRRIGVWALSTLATLDTLFCMHIGPHFYPRIGFPLAVCVIGFSLSGDPMRKRLAGKLMD